MFPGEQEPPSPLDAAAVNPGGGLASGSHTMPGNIMGTPGFMGPEQLQGLPLKFSVDQYALGCILHEMISGQPVFSATSVHALMMKHMIAVPPLLQKLCPQAGVSQAQDALLQRMLAKEPAERFPSMRELEVALQREIDRIQAARGLRPGISTGRRAQLRIGRVAIPLWAVTPVLFGFILALGYAGYYFLVGRKSAEVALSARELVALQKQALAVLRADLKDKDPELKWTALAALGQSRDPQLRSELEAALVNPDPTTRAQAAIALGALGDRGAIPALARLLDRGEPPQVKTVAAASLRQLGDARGERFLEQMLDTKDVETQFRAALFSCDHGPQDVQRVLRAYAQRSGLPDATVSSILSCLARAGDAPALQRLRAQLTDGGPAELRLLAATKLAQMGEADGLKYLHELVRRRDRAQVLAARELALLGETDGLALCRQLVKNPMAQSPGRQLASDGLGAIGEPVDAQALAVLLNDKSDRPLRQAGARAILQIVARDPGLLSEQSMNWARSALGDSDALVRQSATAILGDSMNAGAVSLLAGLLKDKDAGVRRSAVFALGRRKDEQAVVALRNALGDAEPSVRLDALQELVHSTSQLKGDSLRRVVQEVKTALAGLLSSGSQKEQLLAGSLLFRLGDSDQLKSLRTWLTASDAELRRLAVEQLPLTADELAERLGDTALAVRLAAARRLAELGDRRALPVLREALALPGSDAIVAYGLLHRLGVSTPPPAPIDALLADANPAVRIAAVEALGAASGEQAAPLLLRAARDRDPLVRRRAAEIAAEIAASAGGERALTVLRRFLSDGDAAVRARAASLLALVLRTRLEAPAPAAEKGAEQRPEKKPSAVEDGGTKADAAAPRTEPEQTKAENTETGSGTLVIEAQPWVQFQIDRRPWQVSTDRPIPIESGPHVINYLSGQHELTLAPGQTLHVSIPTSQLEQLVRSSTESFSRGDYKKAQRQMDKAVAICSRDSKHSAICAIITFDLVYKLGQIHEQQKEWPEAMLEYQRVLALSPQVRGKGDIKANTEAAVQRLSARLGQVVVPRRGKRGCQEETIWMRPGTTSIKVDTKFETIEVKVKEIVRVGSCK